MPSTPLDSRERLARMGALALGAVVALVATAIDAITHDEVMLPIFYLAALVIVARARSVWLNWTLALILIVLCLFFYYFAGPTPRTDVGLINRIVGGATLLAVAFLLHRHIRSAQALERQRDRLQEINLEVEAANEELGQREEEIVRQNEELQSQTEELERQSEELRVSNEDLAAREKTLEQLLELSRSLTLALTRDEVLTRVCDSLTIVTAGAAAAFLERRGDQLVVVCHNGFEGGPDSEVFPVSETLASLVLSIGQTGYVEDLRQRPDLRIPQPATGDRLHSVMATPVRVRGKSIGTLEVYGHSPKTFAEVEVAIVESLAAQLSISLQNAELVEEIQEQRRRFEAAFRSVPVGMLLIADPEGKTIRINPAGAALLGVPVDENLTQYGPIAVRFRRSVHRDGRPIEEGEFPTQRVLQGQELRSEDYEVVFPDGRRLLLVLSGSPFYDESSRVTGGIVAFMDVSAQKAAFREIELRRREAEEASVRKTRFLAAISHDIRTPANSINLMTHLIRRATETPELASQIPEMAQRLENGVNSLLELVNDLLDLSRFDSGKVEIVESEFPLNDLLREEGEQLRSVAEARGLTLTVEPVSRPVWLRTDRVKLARVVGNLIENATKFTLAGGSVRVSVELAPDPDRRVVIRVADSGIGIPPEQEARIFDEFAQLRNPERDSAKGAGLGLAISKRLVDLLGGKLRVESAVGKGTTFTIELPGSVIALRLEGPPPPASRREEKAGPAAPRLSGLRVLLVEDHVDTRAGMREILVQEGARIDEAPTGGVALERLRQNPYDVILLDLMLPDMDGMEVLKAIDANRPAGLKGVLVLTADIQRRGHAALAGIQPDALLQKPVDLEILVTALQAFQRHPTGVKEGS